MKWVKDRTGRFTRRPHYLPAELDDECEQLITSFLKSRYGSIKYPITTDDLTVLIESLTDNLDLYADLAGEEGEVQGVTDFVPRRRPKVRIAKRLTEDKRMRNRLRTTLTHELGHVHFHSSLFDGERSGDLFAAHNPEGLEPFTRPQNAGEMQLLLAQTIVEVRSGKMDPRIANTIAYLGTAFLSALETWQLETRLEALESRFAPANAPKVTPSLPQ
jgi:hypothetical protein